MCDLCLLNGARIKNLLYKTLTTSFNPKDKASIHDAFQAFRVNDGIPAEPGEPGIP